MNVRQNTRAPIYHHFTNAVDTQNIQIVFNSVKDTILQRNLAALMLQWRRQQQHPHNHTHTSIHAHPHELTASAHHLHNRKIVERAQFSSSSIFTRFSLSFSFESNITIQLKIRLFRFPAGSKCRFMPFFSLENIRSDQLCSIFCQKESIIFITISFLYIFFSFFSKQIVFST